MSLTTPRTQDPVCGMIVPLDTEHQTEHDGRTICFCSDHCRQKYIAAPIGMDSSAVMSSDDLD